MGYRDYGRRSGLGTRRVAGFTLVEMIVALAVIGVAVSVFVSLYGKSRELGRRSINRAIAVELGQAQLAAIVDAPQQFFWEFPEESGRRFPIRLSEEDPVAGNLFAPPVVPPIEEDAKRRTVVRYTQFRWTAQGRLPAPDANHYEVSLVVRWEEAQRPQMLSLTSAVPRFRLAPRDKAAESAEQSAPESPETAEAAAVKPEAPAVEEPPAGPPEPQPMARETASPGPAAPAGGQSEQGQPEQAPQATPQAGAARAIEEVLQ